MCTKLYGLPPIFIRKKSSFIVQQRLSIPLGVEIIQLERKLTELNEFSVYALYNLTEPNQSELKIVLRFDFNV